MSAKSIVTSKLSVYIIKNQRQNQSTIILKQDKGHGVAIMSHSAYTEKYFSILNSS